MLAATISLELSSYRYYASVAFYNIKIEEVFLFYEMDDLCLFVSLNMRYGECADSHLL